MNTNTILTFLLQVDSTLTSKISISDKLTIVSIIVTLVGIIVAISFKKLRLYIMSIFSNFLIRFDKSNAKLIEKYVNDFLNTREGDGYCKTHKASNERNEKLEVKIRESFLKLRKEKTISEINNDIYYFYLFSLLKGTGSNILAISVSSPHEWTNTDDEKLFLKYNIEASNRNILIERIFIIKESETQKLLETKAIQEQIIQSQKSNYFNTLYIYDKDVPRKLLSAISKGFLLFENLAIATDADPDADGKDIEGFIQMVYLERYKNLFIKLKQISNHLNAAFYKEKLGKELNL